ncbi:MAG: hypothetical protein ACOH5I_22320 [Oligoflexus sp.]
MLRSIRPLQDGKLSLSQLPFTQMQSAIDRGYQFLQQELSPQNGFQSLWETERWQKDPSIGKHENFSSLLIANLLGHNSKAEAIRDHLLRILKRQNQGGFTNFFRGTSPVPNDIHSSCLSLEFLLEYGEISPVQAFSAIDRIVANTDQLGVMRLYLEPEVEPLSNVTDPVACLNALYLLNLVGRSEEGEPTYRFVQNYLISRRYLQGTLYYPGAESFLFFLTRLVSHFPFLKLQWAIELKRAVYECASDNAQALELAMRIYTCHHLGMLNQQEIRRLLSMQDYDGSWPSEMLLEDGQGRPLLGSRALTTAFALAALETCHT